MTNLRNIVAQAFLGMEKTDLDKKIFLNIYPRTDASFEELEELEIAFDYHDMRLNFRVKTVHPGMPIQLELEAFGPLSAKDFEEDMRSVCLVKEIVFYCPGQEKFSIRNERFNPSSLS